MSKASEEAAHQDDLATRRQAYADKRNAAEGDDAAEDEAEEPTGLAVEPPTVPEAPDPDSSNITGVYRRPDGDHVTLEATPNARAVYEGKGFVFIGYTPAAPEPESADIKV